jgi:hypothetical protein
MSSNMIQLSCSNMHNIDVKEATLLLLRMGLTHVKFHLMLTHGTKFGGTFHTTACHTGIKCSQPTMHLPLELLDLNSYT